jgi:hypothetical protein
MVARFASSTEWLRPRLRHGLRAFMVSVAVVACGGSGPTADPQSGGSVTGSAATSQTGIGGGSTLPATGSGGVSSAGGNGPTLGACPMFAQTAVFNQRIDDAARFPAHAQSAAWVSAIGSSRRLHADWGSNDNPLLPDTYYGIPYNIVDGSAATTSWPSVSFDASDPATGPGVPDESDCAVAAVGAFNMQRDCTAVSASSRRFPFPLDAVLKAEHGSCNDPRQCGDRHVLIVEQGACRLWESYFSYNVGGQWHVYSTAAWDLRSLAMRPDSWTSGDAAGLPILPLLARADEASAGEIKHALRVTFRDSVMSRAYVWPARHRAGGETPGGLPFGALLRLRADFVVPSTWSTQAQALARAMQNYGLYVADIGSDLYVQGEPHASWSDATITQLQSLRMDQFEFVDLRAITGHPQFSANSLAGAW